MSDNTNNLTPEVKEEDSSLSTSASTSLSPSASLSTDTVSASAENTTNNTKSVNSSSKTTHFGYKDVPEEAKEGLVKEVFDTVASKYDLMNDILSFGIHRLWKKHTIACCAVRPGQKILDLAGGTGDFTIKFSKLVGESGEVTLSDINASMLAEGKKRLASLGITKNVRFVEANAEQLPFPDNYFDVIVISFGLRNVTHKDRALAEMQRVLKPGGRALVLEFSKPTNSLVESAYNLYSFKLLPFIGEVVAKSSDSYRYLAESIRKHPDQETLKKMMEEAGFANVDYQNLSSGIVALHRGFKF